MGEASEDEKILETKPLNKTEEKNEIRNSCQCKKKKKDNTKGEKNE